MRYTLATDHDRRHFDGLDALAHAVEELRARRGLEAVPAQIALSDDDGDALHAGFNLYVTPRGGDRQWVAAALGPLTLDTFMTALRMARGQRRAA